MTDKYRCRHVLFYDERQKETRLIENELTNKIGIAR